MTSTSPERKPTSEIVVAVTAVIVALLPVPLLILYLRNLLAGDPPAYAWVATVGASLLIAVAGASCSGCRYGTRGTRGRGMRRLGLAAVVIGYVAAVVPLVLIVVP